MEQNDLKVQDIDFTVDEIETEMVNPIDPYSNDGDMGGCGGCCCCVRVNCK
ncbi:MAG: hypothetical protein RSD36_16480 [Terrisporobacter sp.]